MSKAADVWKIHYFQQRSADLLAWSLALATEPEERQEELGVQMEKSTGLEHSYTYIFTFLSQI